MNNCPVCNGAGQILGTLATTPWYRCRDCGITFIGGDDDDDITENVARAIGLID